MHATSGARERTLKRNRTVEVSSSVRFCSFPIRPIGLFFDTLDSSNYIFYENTILQIALDRDSIILRPKNNQRTYRTTRQTQFENSFKIEDLSLVYELTYCKAQGTRSTLVSPALKVFKVESKSRIKTKACFEKPQTFSPTHIIILYCLDDSFDD
jgi:hypothetical protein